MRTIRDNTVFVLMGNDMRGPADVVKPICWSAHLEEIIELLMREQIVPDEHDVDTYVDGGYVKMYRKGGPMEWFNPPLSDMPRSAGIKQFDKSEVEHVKHVSEL